MSETETIDPEVTPFVTGDHKPEDLPEGVQVVTPDEMRFLREWSWGPDAYRVDCDSCGDTMVFEKHPADWPNHPGEPGQLRVKIECPKCGHMQWTDGANEQDFSRDRLRAVRAEVEAEVQKRLQAEANGGAPATNGSTVVDVDGADGGAGGDVDG